MDLTKPLRGRAPVRRRVRSGAPAAGVVCSQSARDSRLLRLAPMEEPVETATGVNSGRLTRMPQLTREIGPNCSPRSLDHGFTTVIG